MNNLVIFALLLGFFLIMMYMILLHSKISCNKEVDAVYVKTNKYMSSTGGHGIVNAYAPVFKYTIGEVEYERQTIQVISKKELDKLVVGKKYTILVNEKNPSLFIINKKTEFTDILMLILGLFFIISGILIYFINI